MSNLKNKISGAKPPDPLALSALENLLQISQIADRNSIRIVHDSGQAALPLQPIGGLLPRHKMLLPLEKLIGYATAARCRV